MNKLIARWTFGTVTEAQEFAADINDIGRDRGNMMATCFRDGCEVWINPEYASPYMVKVFMSGLRAKGLIQ